MAELLTPKELITGLLKIGGTPNVDELFELIVNQAPRLVEAKECSIFWKNGAWRAPWRVPGKDVKDIPDGFYRRATYERKKHLIGIDFYEPGVGLTGWVIKHGKSLRLDDITNQAELNAVAEDLTWSDNAKGFQDSTEKDKQRAFLAVPVIINGEVSGVIRIAKTIEPFGKFSEEAEGLLETFAEHIGTIIERVEEARQRDLWEKLYLSGISFEKAEFNTYLQRVADEIPGYLGARGCSIFLKEDISGKSALRLRATTQNGPLKDEVNIATYEIGEGLTGWVAKHNKTLRVRDVDDTKELGKIAEDLVHKGKHEEYVRGHSSFLGAPISIDDRVLGVMRTAQDSRGQFFSSSDQRLAEYFCRNLAVLLQNVALFEKVEFDRNRVLASLNKARGEFSDQIERLLQDLKRVEIVLRELLPESSKLSCFKIGGKCAKEIHPKENSVFVGIPLSAAYKNLYYYGIEPALKDMGLEPWVDFERKSALDVMCTICEGIQSSRIGIIDISEWNPNILFELGLLYGQGHPVILLKREDAKGPVDDLTGLSPIEYGEFDILGRTLKKSLRDALNY